MDLLQKIRSIPTDPGVYLYKNAEGEVIYVGKAKNLRSRVASYFHEGRWEDSKTGTLVREAVDVDYIVVANNKEALALENNFIKQRKPRFNILLRDDKTYPYVKLTLGERFPRVYVTRRLRKDGSAYFGPYFPANLAYRIVDLIHRNFLVPSCKVDLTHFHPRPCLQYYIKRCLGPCVEELTTPEIYQEAVRDVKLFLEGRQTDLSGSLRERMESAAGAEEFERAARYRDLISTVEQLQEKQRIAAAEGDDYFVSFTSSGQLGRGSAIGSDFQKAHTSENAKNLSRATLGVGTVDFSDLAAADDNLEPRRLSSKEHGSVLRSDVGNDVSEAVNFQYHSAQPVSIDGFRLRGRKAGVLFNFVSKLLRINFFGQPRGNRRENITRVKGIAYRL